ncbi:MAG: 1-phosphofructokinase family hexose kinase [Clostridia bacterium]|jgi:1-phosphofructokinase|nr:1-phosphofructokinase family hexose kinase [Clostridia bacterium]
MHKYQVTGVCLNPSIDRALTIDGFDYGGTNRVLGSVDCAGGKGFNVALAAKKLGLRAAATGFVFSGNGDIILHTLSEHGVSDQTLHFQGKVRVNLKVFDKATQVVTELNGKGQMMDADSFAQMSHKMDELAKISHFMVFGGSVAPGLPDDAYKLLIEIANAQGCKCVLDAEGALLKKGITAQPFMIKPNLFELETLVGTKLNTIGEIKTAAQNLINKGVEIVLVSLGQEGALIVNERKAKFAPGIKVDVKNTVGAGDSMVSGAIKGLIDSSELAETLKQAAGAATCSVMQEGTGLTDTSQLKSIYDKIKITDI